MTQPRQETAAGSAPGKASFPWTQIKLQTCLGAQSQPGRGGESREAELAASIHVLWPRGQRTFVFDGHLGGHHVISLLLFPECPKPSHIIQQGTPTRAKEVLPEQNSHSSQGRAQCEHLHTWNRSIFNDKLHLLAGGKVKCHFFRKKKKNQTLF